jgi:hypothetical protein
MAIFGIDLKKMISGAAKTVVSKTAIGGTQQSKDLVKAFANSKMAAPIFDKFGAAAEKGVAIAGGIAATAITAGAAGPLLGAGGGAGALGGLLKSTSGNTGVAGSLIKNFLPAAKDIDFGKLINGGVDLIKGALSKPGTAAQTTSKTATGSSSLPDTKPSTALVIGVGLLLAFVLFGKQIKKMFR